MDTNLSPIVILVIIATYFAILIGISYWTSRSTDNASFFLANRKSPWYLVAFGMVGATLSGATFISIPGVIGTDGANKAFSYMQMVLGYLAGYFVIAAVLLPLYYRLSITSIYEFLDQRFGWSAHKTGAAFFLLSRTIGASFRLYLVAIVLQSFVTGYFGIPFWGTVLITIALIWTYTHRAGMQTIIYTDTIQTLAMLSAVVLTIFGIGEALDMSLGELVELIRTSEYSQVFFFEGGWGDPNNFFKQFLAGMFLTIVMTGLDQDMMQKNLTCKTLREAQINMFSFSIVLVIANVLFISLGALLYLYAARVGIAIPELTDQLYPTIALTHLSPLVGIMFVIGLIAAAYSSADSALTSLTTSFCVDFLGFKADKVNDPSQKKTRLLVHIGFSLLLFIVIIYFNAINDRAMITGLFTAASYTYGPLLGLFAFGILSKKRKLHQYGVIVVCILAPILTYVLNHFSEMLFFGYKFGFELLILNGILTATGLLLVSYYEKER